MLRIFACLLTGTACLLGAVITTHRSGAEGAGMVEQPDSPVTHGSRREARKWTNYPLAPLPAQPAKARGVVHDESLATRLREGPKVVVGGQVRRPGPLTSSPGLTLKAAVERAGGTTEFGSLRRVALIRAGQQVTYNLTLVENQNIPLEPDDTVEVGEVMVIGR